MINKRRTGLENTNSVRTFVGLNIPFDLSRQIATHLKAFSKENRNFVFTNIEQLHITLQFLGEDVSEDSLRQISDKLKHYFSQTESPIIKTGQLRFGHKSQIIPTVLFLEVQQSEELHEITRQIHYIIKNLGLSDVRREKDYKRLIYHITLGRAKHHVSRSFGRNIIKIIDSFEMPEYSFKPKSIELLNSRFTIKGHKYSEYSSYKFKQEKI